MQSQSFYHAICMRLRPKMMQIAVQYASSCDAWRDLSAFQGGRNEGIETIKWPRILTKTSFSFLFGRGEKC